ncbi:aliphatic sulfonate ABC transporter substrate-binding protein [Paenibacillus paeoniae]|uniref:Putative aliphatic sulfonates-binding protein n=1 Tax=Paenibacillus paeoniae TaxID=2292705 RepID=A0A371P6I1_9BACL|nr:aliphatic sulfonate ABC transporter substrate-binding protein [Paenibacillus paeoniae]REK71529.1 aliphatic sulfonate ABC transporter substrate-binding protein [Paenibacillus paeoniae]
MKSFRWLTTILLLLAILASGCANGSSSGKNGKGEKSYDGVTIKIGYQGSGGLFGKIIEEKWFEEEFDKLGVKVEFAQFQSGPPMTEAMASGRLDTAGLGNMPIIAAQAAGIEFKVISQSLEGKNNVAIIVPKDSSIQSVQDLKGKKVAVAKGSNAFNFLYRGLAGAGLAASDLEIIPLQPDEAQPAFETGKVDAWSTWDPTISLNVLQDKARVLADGEQLGVLSPSFYIARKAFADQYPELVTLYLKVLNKALKWENEHWDEALERYAGERNVPSAVIEAIYTRSKGISIPVSDAIIAEQQKTADFQYEIENIRKKIDVSEVFDNSYIEAALKE